MHLLKNNYTTLVYGLVVLLPLVIIGVYLFVLAQDRYISSSIVVVKQVGQIGVEQNNGWGALLGVNNTSSEDSQILKAYMQSPDIVYALDKKLNLRKAFTGDGIDPIFQLSKDASKEDLVEHFNKRVEIVLDEKTMMLKITTQGMSPDFALLFNKLILTQSEHFINQISQRIAQEQLEFATNQLSEATKQLTKARGDLISYQNRNKMFDPQSQAIAVAQLIVGLETNLAQLKTEERALLSYLNSNAPQLIALRSQILALQSQIQDEKSQLTSPSNANKLNQRAADFEALKAQVDFSTDLYKISLTALEKSRLEAGRKLKKLVIITSPQIAQDAYYPRRGYILLSAFLILTILFGIAQLIISIIREHQE